MRVKKKLMVSLPPDFSCGETSSYE